MAEAFGRFAERSRTRMPKAVEAEISSGGRVIRLEPPRAVGHGVSGHGRAVN